MSRSAGRCSTKRRIHEDDVVALAHRLDEANRVAGFGGQQPLGGRRRSRVGGSLKRGEHLRLNSTECVGAMPSASVPSATSLPVKCRRISAASRSSTLRSGPSTGACARASRMRCTRSRRSEGSEARRCSHDSDPSGSARAVMTFGRGSGRSRQCRRARKTIAAEATCAQRGSMSIPHRVGTMRGGGICWLDAL